ncbi:MAG: amino acid ABC transporter permease [Burkholderiaceae bacterium]|jgi:glutamate/aspartate transport system permease protein|nr:amino acid ABC transporter permease [Burkholderiaceae bacterium]
MGNWNWSFFLSWDWSFLKADPGGKIPTYWQWLVSAWGWTAAVAACSLALALVAGSVVGVLRTLTGHTWWARLGAVWVELFRNIPLLVQLFVWRYVLTLLPVIKDFSAFTLMVLALGLFTSARIAEQVRAGIQALPRGQRHAAMALGLSTPQTYRHVLLPMAYRIILPPLTSESMNIVKNSAVAFAASIPELAQYFYQVTEETSRTKEIFILVVLLYVITALAVWTVMHWIEKRTRVPGFVGAAAGGH